MIGTHDPLEPTAIIAPMARHVIVTEPAHIRAIPAHDLAGLVRAHISRVEEIPDRGAALSRAMALAERDDVVCVTGSVYLVSDVRNRLIEDGLLGADTERKSSEAARR
jgi:dihydrofolate synthase/folylpolyglutamate synthase